MGQVALETTWGPGGDLDKSGDGGRRSGIFPFIPATLNNPNNNLFYPARRSMK